MLSKEGFKFHLDNIEHHAKWAEYYGEQMPELSKVAQDSVDRSKEILLSHFKEQQKEVEKCEDYLSELGFSPYWREK